MHVLVTGAGKGIGRACVLRFARAGHHVFAGVRSAAAGAELRREAPGITPLELDVTNTGQIQRAAELIAQNTGNEGLYGLVNNAGIAVAGPLEYLPIDALRRQLEVNVIGQIAVAQAMLPMIRQARGRIVNIGSIAGRSTLALTGPYSSSKFALEALTDALRGELLPWGIHVAIVEPGVIKTPIWETSAAAGREMLERMPPLALESYGSRLETLWQLALRNVAHGLEPAAVARAVAHALFARRPKTRYLVGWDARLRVIFNLLPDRWRDRIVDSQLTRKLAGDKPHSR